MLKNFFLSFLRNSARQKVYTFLNILSLSLGIAVCIIVYLFVTDELSYDDQHYHGDSIYRITMDEDRDGIKRSFANTFSPLAQHMKTEFPEIQQCVRIFPGSRSVKVNDDHLFQEENFAFADSNLFEVFTYNFIIGDAKTSLREPNSIVISEATAKKYFGNQNPLGKTLIVDAEFLFKVTGVFRDPPHHTSLGWNIFATMSSVGNIIGSWVFNSQKSWHYPPMFTFVLLENEKDAQRIEKAFPVLVKKMLGENFKPIRSFHLQPLNDIHLTAGLENEPFPTSNKIYIYIFSIIGFLILLVACINFTNLATVRSIKRAKEVGLKKTSGAGKGHILIQFLGESVITAIISLLISLVIVEAAVPLLNSLFDLVLSTRNMINPVTVSAILLITLITGISAGFYPAIILSKINPTEIFRGTYGIKKQGRGLLSFKEILIVLQFAISSGIIISAFVIQDQLDYINNASLGFKKEHLIVLPIKNEKVQFKYDVFKERLLHQKGILSITSLSNFPWESGFYDFPVTINKKTEDLSINPSILLIDKDFAKTFKVKMFSGRDFSEDIMSDKTRAFLINKSAIDKFELDNPVGTKISVDHLSSGKPKEGEIIGVVNDFHFQSLYHKVEPLIITISNDYYYYDNIVIRFGGQNLKETIKDIENIWKEFSPNYPFSFFFLDQTFDNLYRSEVKLSSIFNSFSLLSIIIGILGMFGLTSYSIQVRRKEIGIRKILGASAIKIAVFFVKDFLKVIILANFIALPITYFIMNNWLENFAYKISFPFRVYVITVLFLLGVTLFSVFYQIIKASHINPVESLRYE